MHEYKGCKAQLIWGGTEMGTKTDWQVSKQMF